MGRRLGALRFVGALLAAFALDCTEMVECLVELAGEALAVLAEDGEAR
jgi:hypothetical protein